MNVDREVPPVPTGYNLTNDAFDEGPVELVKCEGCGRNFKEEALERHAKICKKVFLQKRKAFDSAANRLGELENAGELIKNAKKIEKEVEQKTKEVGRTSPKAEEVTSKKPVPAWKKKSLEFRAAMLAGKAMTGDKAAEAQEKLVKQELAAAGGNEPESDPSKTVCPHCSRSFNNDSAQRHIDICLKMFGGKKGGGGRLMRGGGKSCNPATVAQQAAAATAVPTAARNKTRPAPAGDAPPQARRTSNDGTRGGSHGPPPMPGGRGEQPPSRERVGAARR